MAEFRERLEGALLHGALALPDGAQRRLAGRPVVREGQRLSTEVQLMLRLESIAGAPAAEDLPWEQARAALARQSRLVGGHQPIGSIRDLGIDGPGGALPMRLYTPTAGLGRERVPTLVFLHGGGMVYGGAHSTHDQAIRALAEISGVQVLSVDYRLAPEHPYPAAVTDGAAAYRWLIEHAEEMHADPERLAVGGDSAGGYLAATTAIRAAEEGLPLAWQLLIYPVTDFVGRSGSRNAFARDLFLTEQFMTRATDAFLPDPATREEASILRRSSLPGGLAPAYVVTAGFDPLRDEGEAYARLLEQHGVKVETRRYPSMIHGFFNMVGAGREAASYHREIATVLGQTLA